MSSIFGVIGVETPKFTVLQALGSAGCEVRQYAPCIRAEFHYEAAPNAAIMDNLNSPFRALAGYIFGGNEKHAPEGAHSEKIAMTAPVVMQQQQPKPQSEKVAMTAPVVMQKVEGGASGANDARVMTFMMPSKYTSISDLPVPKDPRVKLVEVPPRTMAAVHFRGYMNDAVAKQKEEQLRAACKEAGVVVSEDRSEVQHCAFNPPWTLPFLKTNEVLIPVLSTAGETPVAAAAAAGGAPSST